MEKTLIAFDVDATLVDSESNQGLFYRQALLRIFADNPEVIENINKTLSEDEAKCRTWYYENLMGKVPEQQKIISRFIAPVTLMQMGEIWTYVDANIILSLSEDSASGKIKNLIEELSKNENVELCFVSGGSEFAVSRELLFSGVLNETSVHYGLFTREYFPSKQEILRRIMDFRGYDAKHVICVGDGVGDMKMGTFLDEEGSNAYRIGYIGYFATESEQFKAERKSVLINGGADIVAEDCDELRSIIMRKVRDNALRLNKNQKRDTDFERNMPQNIILEEIFTHVHV